MPLMPWSVVTKKFILSNMMNYLFTIEQGNILIRLLLAHLGADFVLQSSKMVKNKEWFSPYMLLHIAIVFTITFIISGLWQLSLVITILHWLLDSVKVEVQKRSDLKPILLFVIDQVIHFIIITVAWFWYFHLLDKIVQTISLPFINYKFSLILLAYTWLIYPVGFLIRFATQSIAHTSSSKAVTTTAATTAAEDKLEQGGKLIGQFERIIILTLVLLNQYEAIGFLITGKSIIRFADHNSNLRSEYVLVGTMMCYAYAILTGVFVNYMISL